MPHLVVVGHIYDHYNVSQRVFVILLWGISMSPLMW